MRTALIGHTGFVGGTICRQGEITEGYNSQNIDLIRSQTFDLLICAGAPGAKWKANQDSDGDLANMKSLIGNLASVRARQFVLISTVDVYPRPVQVNESTRIDSDRLEPYGRHRYLLEQAVRGLFPDAVILRLPGLYGAGLKKNFVYDLLNGNALHMTDYRSVFQFYDMSRLWDDLNVALKADLRLVNLATEPVSAGDVARHSFGVDFSNTTPKGPVNYDMRTRHAELFGGRGPYLQSADYTFQHISQLRTSQELTATL